MTINLLVYQYTYVINMHNIHSICERDIPFVLFEDLCLSLVLEDDSSYELCEYLVDVQCSDHEGGTVCGSNNMTYANEYV